MTFDIDETIQSQYAASPTITALAKAIWNSLNPQKDIDLLYDKMINLDTAEGVGLDVWGRIVGMPREYVMTNTDAPYLGFQPDPGVTNNQAAPFNQAPFYATVNGKVRLGDNAYRAYIYLKAMMNIGDSSLAGLNRMLKVLFPNGAVQLQHIGTMTLRLMILKPIDEAVKAALLSLPWLPAGVGLDVYQVLTPTFGFNGSGLNPFNQGTFASDRQHSLTNN